jgi:hypothetical protein
MGTVLQAARVASNNMEEASETRREAWRMKVSFERVLDRLDILEYYLSLNSPMSRDGMHGLKRQAAKKQVRSGICGVWALATD